MLTAAREKQLAVSREKFNQSQVETIFIPGEHVRLWKRVPIRRHEGSGEIASKLKLFNKEYLVVKREGTRYRIRDVITGKETDAHVSQIARMRSYEDEREEEAAPIVSVRDRQTDSGKAFRSGDLTDTSRALSVAGCPAPNVEANRDA